MFTDSFRYTNSTTAHETYHLSVELISENHINKDRTREKRRKRKEKENATIAIKLGKEKRTKFYQMKLLKAIALLFQCHYSIGCLPCYEVVR